MRSKNALINLLAYFSFEIISFALNIIFPRFIILNYGSEVNGLTSTILKLLSIVNLIQAGAVGAAGVEMFKPVAKNDYETQSAIIYSSRKFYNIVTTIYFCASCVLGGIYSYYLQSEELCFFEIFMSFLILGLSGCFPLFFNSITDIYVSAHQKAYYLKLSSIVNLLVHYSMLTIVLILKLHYLYMYLAMLMGSAVNGILNYVFYKKLSKGKITQNPNNKSYVISNRKFIMFSTIGTEAMAASPIVIITSLIDLSAASVFSIYSMIFGAMKTIINSIQYSIVPIFGNAMNTTGGKHLRNIYDCIELVSILLGTFVSACCAFLLVPFISVYTNGINDANYLNVPLAILVIIYIISISFRLSFYYVSGIYGLFKEQCKITLFFGLVSVLISILCVMMFGFPYVMVGLIVNEIGNSVSILLLLKKKVEWFTLNHLIRRGTVLLFVPFIVGMLRLFLNPKILSLGAWIICAILVSISVALVLLLYCLLFEKTQIAQISNYCKLILKRRRYDNI